jgi:hypothetical protein
MAQSGLSQLSLGEAHCYVAVVKADGRVTSGERARAPYHAKKSQKRFGLFKRNAELAERVGGDVTRLLGDSSYQDWTADQHLDEGVSLLREAARAGSRGVDISADKLESGLFELAYLDGYDIRESTFVKKALGRLRELENS